jgi:cytosine deaminase
VRARNTGFAEVPTTPRYVLLNATLPAALLDDPPKGVDRDGLVAGNVFIVNGKIEKVTAPGHASGTSLLDMSGGMVFPCFVDMHTHIDKGHIWPRKRNPDGTFTAALDAVGEDRRANWTADDVARRMDFSLRSAFAHGTSLLRTHIDSASPQHRISWPVFAEMRAAWAGRIELQGVSLFAIDDILDDSFAGEMAATVKEHGGVLGAATFMIARLDEALDRMLLLAADNRLDLDFHVDESEDPAARSLARIASAAIRHRFAGRINVAHICSLTLQPPAEQEATMAQMAEAGISVVSLPMCNMYLQDRHGGRTPRWRGVTLVHELAARGIPVAVASDNTRDPFYAYGDLDMLEVFREAVRIAHLDHPFAAWPPVVAKAAAEIIGRPDHGLIGAGRPADLVLFRARNWTELLARPQSDRTVLRSGEAIDRTLPDYRELDDLMGGGCS